MKWYHIPIPRHQSTYILGYMPLILVMLLTMNNAGYLIFISFPLFIVVVDVMANIKRYNQKHLVERSEMQE